MAGTPQLVLQRGLRNRPLFRCAADFRQYLEELRTTSVSYGCSVHAYALLPRETRLLLTSPHRGTLPRMMQALSRRFAYYVNARDSLSGPCWQGRYKSCPVGGRMHVLLASGYVEQSPVRVGIVANAAAYRWSSYACNALGIPNSVVSQPKPYVDLSDDDPERRARYRAWIEGLKQHVVDDPRLVAMIDRQLAPREVDPEQLKLEAELERHRAASESREAKNHADWVAFWREVAEHPETAFSTEKEDNTTWNLWMAMRHSGDESRASGWSRRFIERHFGKEVADRVRVSMRPIWRRDRPTLRHEREESERTKIFVRWQLGLAAIYAEAEDPAWARSITAAEAELAARYVPIELNGFPAWLDVLAREHPETVERTLGSELTDELDEIATLGSFAVFLQNLTHASNIVVELFLPRLCKWIDTCGGCLRDGESESAAVDKLARALEILVDHGDEETLRHLQDVAERMLHAAMDGPFAPVWLTTIMRLDPGSGVSAFECMLAALTPEDTHTAVHLLGTMFGERRGGLRVDLGKPGFTPELLLRLARLAYQHVHPSADVKHEGVYSPSPRDHAEEGRGLILKAIVEAKGAEAWAVKVQMTNDPLFAHFRDRLALLAREKAAEEADDVALGESDLVTLDRYGEAPPANRDEMFSLLIDRLEDLEDSLLLDTSPRAAWAGITDEKIMRQQIARELQLAGRGIYTVDQEAVTADEKETDIRLRVPASGQQATIELKIGEKWSGRELRDTIKSQLVTKYMAAEICRSGCLLVTISDAKRAWKHPDTDEQMNIDGLRNLLETEAAKVTVEMAGSLRLVINILDLRPRLSAES